MVAADETKARPGRAAARVLRGALFAALLLTPAACGRDHAEPEDTAKPDIAAALNDSIARGARAGDEAGKASAGGAGDIFMAPMGAPFVERFAHLDEAHRWFVSDGWSNGDWTSSDFRRSQLAVDEDGLNVRLSANAEGAAKPYSGGEFRTQQMFKYGYFETRMRVPRGDGLITGVFTYTPAENGRAAQEIDIEIVGRATRQVEFTIHNRGKVEFAYVDLPFDAAEDFHTYAIEWKPRSVTWYIDGQPMHTMRGKIVPIPDRPQALIVDLWNSAALWRWVGHIDNSAGPWTLTASCIAYAPHHPGRQLCAPAPAAPMQTAAAETNRRDQ
jgi:beta-glucanase (GH16 family)